MLAAATAEAAAELAAVPEGAAAGRPLTGLTPRMLLEGLAAGADMALKRTLGTTDVERDVEEALSTTVLTTVFWTVV